jgi:hypothetical protein
MVMMKMQFINGAHRSRPMVKPQSAINTQSTLNNNKNNSIAMSGSKREPPSNRFNMDKNMRLKNTGCKSCSGVR